MVEYHVAGWQEKRISGFSGVPGSGCDVSLWSGGGNYGFLNVQKGTANGKNNTGAATAVLGYSFWLRK
jgi:hypothetical protein